MDGEVEISYESNLAKLRVKISGQLVRKTKESGGW